MPLKPCIAIAIVIGFFSGCAKEPEVADTYVVPHAPAAAVVAPAPKKEEPRYVYHGEQRPDPFVPQNIESASVAPGEMITPNIASLSLKGIFTSGRQKMAIISGGGLTYLLKDSRLYDNRQRIIKGLSGAIKNESVIIIAQDKTMRELKIREK